MCVPVRCQSYLREKEVDDVNLDSRSVKGKMADLWPLTEITEVNWIHASHFTDEEAESEKE